MFPLTHSGESNRVIAARAQALFQQSELHIHRRTDKMLAVLLLVQWLGGIAAALWLSPRDWVGENHSVHVHVWAAIFLGGAIAALPSFLALTQQGRVVTRHAMAIGQMSSAALLIHLTGGRIETHFQIFGVLAFLAFYRDWRILISAMSVVAIDHALRGFFFPHSIFGILTVSPWRWLEHVGWVLFEAVFLLLSIRQNRSDMFGAAQRTAELEASHATVERKVAERTVQLTTEIAARKRQENELARACDAALESARLKAEFLANMSHEIRTPMNGVIGMTGLLLDTPLLGEQKEFVETIRSCGDALLTLINDILDFSKIEAGKLSFETLDFDLGHTVESVVDLLAERAQTKKLELISLIQDDVPIALRGDPGRLRQVLMNLIGNAVKFTERGEVVVCASLDSETESSAVVRFTVQDTGIGISEEGRRSLFRAFSQADGSVTRRYGGSGLGLAISKQLVEIMGGTVGVDSVPGAGSTFWFTARFDKQPQPLPLMSAEALALLQVRALIIDDNASSRRILELQLGSRGILCEAAPSAVEAMTRLRSARQSGRPLHIAFIDLHMPDIDGLELACCIKADPLLASTTLILLSEIGSSEQEERIQAAGIALCLSKPIKQTKLFDALTETLLAARSQPNAGTSGAASFDAGAPFEGSSTTAPRHRSHILVAEDNPINQKVLLWQLAKLGYRADAVANGLEAISAIEKIPYDLVLLDCQMPEMDGYTAARELRRLEKGAKLHIIALTAHTMQGDREKCLAAGMDDYLGKPVKLEDLEQKISGWLGGRSSAGLAKVAAASQDPVDLPALRLAAGHEDDFLREIIDLYLAQATELLAAAHQAAERGAATELERLAHTLAGSSLIAGMRAMLPPLRKLEGMARKGELLDAQPCITEATAQLERVRRFLSAACFPLESAA